MSFTEERKVITREKRLSTLSNYNGTLQQLKKDAAGDEIAQRIRTFAQTAEDEIISAIKILSKIKQAAIVVHGAVGCSASGLYFNGETPIQWYSTNLNERDTILGGDEKLRNAIYRACREQNPKAVFIVGTPVVAINNDDVNSVILELEDELGINIISVYTDGFKTKSATNGYDVVLHGLLKYIVDRSDSDSPKDDFVNIVTVSENVNNLLTVTKIFSDLGIEYRLLPQFSDIDTIRNAGKAKATVVLNEEDGGLFAEELEEVFNVPYIRTVAPIGFTGTRNFILTLAKALDIENKAKAYIEAEEQKYQAFSDEAPLKNKTIFLEANLYSLPELLKLTNSLGGRTVSIAVASVDLNNRKYLEAIEGVDDKTPIIVGVGQPFEKVNVLNKTSADYYISISTNPLFAAEQGSSPISLAKRCYYGYEGVKSFINAVKEADRQQKLLHLAAERDKFYKSTWLRRSSNWYVKQEVK